MFLSSTFKSLVLSAVLTGFLTPFVLRSQDQAELEVPAGLGFIRFVNATGAEGKLMVFIEGTVADPAGYPDGEATGALGLLPKMWNIEFQHEVLGKLKVPVELKMGEISTVIALAVPESPKDSDKDKGKGAGKPKLNEEGAEPKLVLGSFVHIAKAVVPEGDSSLTLLQFTPAKELSLSISGTAYAVPRATPITLPITDKIGAFPEVHLAGRAVCLLNFKFPADQLVVFFTGSDGVLKHAPLRNEVQ